MSDKKNKKKTLTISTNLTKKIDISSLSRDGKKAFSIDKKNLTDLLETINHLQIQEILINQDHQDKIS